jgi:hypothetical protein
MEPRNNTKVKEQYDKLKANVHTSKDGKRIQVEEGDLGITMEAFNSLSEGNPISIEIIEITCRQINEKTAAERLSSIVMDTAFFRLNGRDMQLRLKGLKDSSKDLNLYQRVLIPAFQGTDWFLFCADMLEHRLYVYDSNYSKKIHHEAIGERLFKLFSCMVIGRT